MPALARACVVHVVGALPPRQRRRGGQGGDEPRTGTHTTMTKEKTNELDSAEPNMYLRGAPRQRENGGDALRGWREESRKDGNKSATDSSFAVRHATLHALGNARRISPSLG